MVIAFHKPFGVLSQFTADHDGQQTLAAFGFPPRVYPLGRLDLDSEGLLLLSDEPGLNTRLLTPDRAHWRRYAVQVEGTPDSAALRRLADGVMVQGRQTLPARAWVLTTEPSLPPRTPPIRVRRNIPTSWIAVELREGRNRQVRRMTAAVGHPTLRLIRIRVGHFDLPGNLPSGQWRELNAAERGRIFATD